jgi:predicted amidohydrolase YtcJ
MRDCADLILRRVRPFGGAETSLVVKAGVIVGHDAQFWSGPELDAAGGHLFPGLIDHHVHLLATAARQQSVDLAGLTNEADIIRALRGHARSVPHGSWVRAVNYDERSAGLPDAERLSQWLPHHRLRVQDRTGALWMLNRLALDGLGAGPFPTGVDCDADGAPTGLIWREDEWLRTKVPQDAPDLAALSRQCAVWGITGLTDAGASNGEEAAQMLSAARASGALLQRMCLMGHETLPDGEHFVRGALKLLYDDADMPDLDAYAARIRMARTQGRSVAAHCVTVAELALFLAALDAAGGGQWGDRVEHGGLIPASFIPEIRRHALTVVTQPDFIRTRGDRYRAEIDPSDWPDLYRLASLARGGVAVSVGSDAPYGSLNSWDTIRSAARRKTRDGFSLRAGEALPPEQVLAMYCGSFGQPSVARDLSPGSAADFVLLDPDWAAMLHDDTYNPVRGTWINGVCCFGVGL